VLLLLLKNPFFFGFTIIIAIALQVWASYSSIHSLLEGDFLLGFSFFFLVTTLAFLMGFYYVWFRKKRSLRKSLSNKE
jgi:predicted Co/Zn/Cd cation transporter (cation efflux family)